MALLTGGLALFRRIHVHSSSLDTMLPASLLTSSHALRVQPSTMTAPAASYDTGPGSPRGSFNTARMFGAALGLTVLATLAASHSKQLIAV